MMCFRHFAASAALSFLLLATPALANDRAVEIFLQQLQNQRAQHGLVEADFSDFRVTDRYQSADTGITHLYLRQQINGIDILNRQANANILPDGQVLLAFVDYAPGVDRSRFDARPALSAVAATSRVAEQLGLVIREALFELEAPFGVDQALTLSAGGISEDPIPARLVYVDTERYGLRLAWELLIDPIGRPNYWHLAADAESGEILVQYDWTVEHNQADIALSDPRPLSRRRPAKSRHDHDHHHDHDHAPIMPVSSVHGLESRGTSASYRVFGLPFESPTAPGATHTLIENPAHPVASPFGWHDTTATSAPDFTITRGNNVHAYLDTNNSNSPDPGSEPDGGPSLLFDFVFDPALEPSAGSNPQASVVSLFYWNNVTHDLLYVHGFDEPAGNFQVNNYGRGGAGGDDVRAEGQDGGGTNNANFFTPTDGNRPRMQMYNWSLTSPNRDGDFDAGIIAHEYGHGWSIRLTGGPGNSSCLANQEQMGEGWSDFLSVVFTAQAADTRTTNRGVGTYALGQPPTGNGIRPAPYNTDMAINGYTYADLPNMAVPHGVGFVWNTMLWDLYWNLVDEYGFNPNLYDDWTTGGNNLTLRLVSDGLKLQPCSPGFVDGRDAILAADQALTGGANQCLIWDAFARRGLGSSAIQGSTGSSTDGTAAFDLPNSCLGLNADAASLNVCQGETASFTVSAGAAFVDSIMLSAVGNPAPSTVSFLPNPIESGGSATATVDNTIAVAAGSYAFDVTGDDGEVSDSVAMVLNVASEAPGAAVLLAPANGATELGLSPMLSWGAPAQGQSYLVEVATDAGFSNIVVSDVVEADQLALANLGSATIYYWRVTAGNACGTGDISEVYSFGTEALPGDCSLDQATETVLFENFEAAAPGWTADGTNNTWQSSTARTYSGERAYLAVNLASVSDQRLTSPAFVLPSDTDSLSLTFWNYQILERRAAGGCWDGGIVEISTDGGSNWIQLSSDNHPYDGPIQSGYGNPLVGLSGWCGEPRAWHRPAVDLSAYAGQTAQLRFRLGTDNTVGREGWYIDDVRVQACNTRSEHSVGGVASGVTAAGLVVQNNGGNDLSIESDGPFSFPGVLLDGDSYEVTIASQIEDENRTCRVVDGRGTIAASDIETVQLICSDIELFEDRFEVVVD
jgi:hypothetical protein